MSGVSLSDPSSTSGPVTVPPAPRARRDDRPSWRDPRIAIGLLVIAGSVLVGATVLGDADETVPVWVVTVDAAAGQEVDALELSARSVRFVDADLAGRYVSASRPVPSGSVLVRPVGAGELLPRSALGAADSGPALVEVPVSAAVEAVPRTVGVGSVVDVWVGGDPSAAGAERVLDDVVVVDAPQAEAGLAPASTRSLVLGVPPDQVDALPALLAAVGEGSGRIVVTREP